MTGVQVERKGIIRSGFLSKIGANGHRILQSLKEYQTQYPQDVGDAIRGVAPLGRKPSKKSLTECHAKYLQSEMILTKCHDISRKCLAYRQNVSAVLRSTDDVSQIIVG